MQGIAQPLTNPYTWHERQQSTALLILKKACIFSQRGPRVCFIYSVCAVWTHPKKTFFFSFLCFFCWTQISCWAGDAEESISGGLYLRHQISLSLQRLLLLSTCQQLHSLNTPYLMCYGKWILHHQNRHWTWLLFILPQWRSVFRPKGVTNAATTQIFVFLIAIFNSLEI